MAVAPQRAPRVGPGTIVYIESAQNYQYGVGPLALRITTLEVPAGQLATREWVKVWGHKIGVDGRIDHRQLEFRIKVSVLLASVKEAGFIPPPTRS